ncbi:hypothetical protein [Longimicrobium sp.]|uniref:hypothetical protein n=1 Tax=Longimicrobium sp. TaxID=2029185 RepID=UPI002C11D4FB|nr:hypothetical protein [Longimicrobium sp.]HSU13294.1 hypothetical protein [Longimicrobium sp.]
MPAALAPPPSRSAAADDTARGGGAFPGGKRFAFTLLDDTDDATVENVRPVYDLLHELGMRTTKTAWPLDCPEGSELYFAGATLQEGDYLAFVRELVERGFELAFHNATMETSDRERTLRGLRFLDERVGAPMAIHCNHGQNGENLYWGAHRYRTALLRLPLLAAERIARRPRFDGHDPASPRFWGDVCRERFRFVRNFTFPVLNSGAIPPHGPYRLRSTPWVRHWFNTADAPDAAAFKRLVTRRAVDRLVAEGGVCILSTHLGKGFARGGRVDPAVEDALRHVASLDGWFVPASTILEHQLAMRGTAEISPIVRWGLEMRHLASLVRSRFSSPRSPAAP